MVGRMTDRIRRKTLQQTEGRGVGGGRNTECNKASIWIFMYVLPLRYTLCTYIDVCHDKNHLRRKKMIGISNLMVMKKCTYLRAAARTQYLRSYTAGTKLKSGGLLMGSIWYTNTSCVRCVRSSCRVY